MPPNNLSASSLGGQSSVVSPGASSTGAEWLQSRGAASTQGFPVPRGPWSAHPQSWPTSQTSGGAGWQDPSGHSPQWSAMSHQYPPAWQGQHQGSTPAQQQYMSQQMSSFKSPNPTNHQFSSPYHPAYSSPSHQQSSQSQASPQTPSYQASSSPHSFQFSQSTFHSPHSNQDPYNNSMTQQAQFQPPSGQPFPSPTASQPYNSPPAYQSPPSTPSYHSPNSARTFQNTAQAGAGYPVSPYQSPHSFQTSPRMPFTHPYQSPTHGASSSNRFSSPSQANWGSSNYNNHHSVSKTGGSHVAGSEVGGHSNGNRGQGQTEAASTPPHALNSSQLLPSNQTGQTYRQATKSRHNSQTSLNPKATSSPCPKSSGSSPQQQMKEKDGTGTSVSVANTNGLRMSPEEKTVSSQASIQQSLPSPVPQINQPGKLNHVGHKVNEQIANNVKDIEKEQPNTVASKDSVQPTKKEPTSETSISKDNSHDSSESVTNTKISTLDFKPESLPKPEKKADIVSSTPMIEQLLSEESPARMNISQEERDAAMKKPLLSPTITKPKKKSKSKPGTKIKSRSTSNITEQGSNHQGFNHPFMMNQHITARPSRSQSISLPFRHEERMQHPSHGSEASWQQQQQFWKQQNYPGVSPQWQMPQHYQSQNEMQFYGQDNWQSMNNKVGNYGTSGVSSVSLSNSRVQQRSFSADSLRNTLPDQHNSKQPQQSMQLANNPVKSGSIESQSPHTNDSSAVQESKIVKEETDNEKSSLSSLLQLVSDVGTTGEDQSMWENTSSTVASNAYPSTSVETDQSNQISSSPSMKDFITLESSSFSKPPTHEAASSDTAGITSSEESDKMESEIAADIMQVGGMKSNHRLGKQQRIRKLALSRRGPWSSSPVEPNASYTFTFHVPTPVFKKLKFYKNPEERKHGVKVVRMHPMDARRYSLLKIGKEMVKAVKLTDEDLERYNATFPPPSLNPDGSCNRVNLDIPYVNIDKLGDGSSSEDGLSRFDTDFPPNRVAPPSTFHASQVSASLSRSSSAARSHTTTSTSASITDWPLPTLQRPFGPQGQLLSSSNSRVRSYQQPSYSYSSRVEDRNFRTFSVSSTVGPEGLQNPPTFPMYPQSTSKSDHYTNAPVSDTAPVTRYFSSQDGSYSNHSSYSQSSRPHFHSPQHPHQSPTIQPHHSPYYAHSPHPHSPHPHQYSNMHPQTVAANYSNEQMESKNELRSPGQHGPTENLTDNGRISGQSGEEAEREGATLQDGCPSTTGIFPVTRVNAQTTNHHAKRLANCTAVTSIHHDLCVSSRENASTTFSCNKSSVELVSDEPLIKYETMPETKENYPRGRRKKKRGRPRLSLKRSSTVDSPQETIALHENPTKLQNSSQLNKNNKEVLIADNENYKQQKDCLKPDLKIPVRNLRSRNVKSLSLQIPKPVLNGEFPASSDSALMTSSKISVPSSYKETSDDGGSDESPSFSRQCRRKTRQNSSNYSLRRRKVKQKLDEEVEMKKNSQYLNIDNLKGHKSLRVKISPVQVSKCCSVNAKMFEEVANKAVIRRACFDSDTNNSNPSKPKILNESESSSSEENANDSDKVDTDTSSVTKGRYRLTRTAYNARNNHIHSGNSSTLNLITDDHSSSSSLSSNNHSKNVQAGPFPEQGASENDSDKLPKSPDKFFYKFKKYFIKKHKEKESMEEEAYKTSIATYFPNLQESEFADFQRKFENRMLKMHQQVDTSSSSDDEDEFMDDIILKGKIFELESMSPYNSQSSYSPSEPLLYKVCDKDKVNCYTAYRTSISNQDLFYRQAEVKKNNKNSNSHGRDDYLKSQMAYFEDISDDSDSNSTIIDRSVEYKKDSVKIDTQVSPEPPYSSGNPASIIQRVQAENFHYSTYISDPLGLEQPELSNQAKPNREALQTDDDTVVLEQPELSNLAKSTGEILQTDDDTIVDSEFKESMNEKANVHESSRSSNPKLAFSSTSERGFSFDLEEEIQEYRPPTVDLISLEQNDNAVSQWEMNSLSKETKVDQISSASNVTNFGCDGAFDMNLKMIQESTNHLLESLSKLHPVEKSNSKLKSKENSLLDEIPVKTFNLTASEEQNNDKIENKNLFKPISNVNHSDKDSKSIKYQALKKSNSLDQSSSNEDSDFKRNPSLKNPGKILRQRKQNIKYNFTIENIDSSDDMVSSSSDSDEESFSTKGRAKHSKKKISKNQMKKEKISVKNNELVKKDLSSINNQNGRTNSKRGRKKKGGGKLLNSLSLLHMATLANLTESPGENADNLEESEDGSGSHSQYGDSVNQDHEREYSPSLETMSFISPPASEECDISPPVAFSPTSKRNSFSKSVGRGRGSRRILNFQPRQGQRVKPGVNGSSNLGTKPLPFRHLVQHSSASSSPVPSNFTFNDTAASQTDITPANEETENVGGGTNVVGSALQLLETKRAQVNCASFSMKDILKLTNKQEDSMDSDSKDMAPVIKPPDSQRAKVKSTSLSMSDIIKLTSSNTCGEDEEQDNQPSSSLLLQIASFSENKVKSDEGGEPPSSSLKDQVKYFDFLGDLKKDKKKNQPLSKSHKTINTEMETKSCVDSKDIPLKNKLLNGEAAKGSVLISDKMKCNSEGELFASSCNKSDKIEEKNFDNQRGSGLKNKVDDDLYRIKKLKSSSENCSNQMFDSKDNDKTQHTDQKAESSGLMMTKEQIGISNSNTILKTEELPKSGDIPKILISRVTETIQKEDDKTAKNSIFSCKVKTVNQRSESPLTNNSAQLKPLNPLQIPTCTDPKNQTTLSNEPQYDSSPYCWQWPVPVTSTDALSSPLNLCTSKKSSNSYSPVTPTSPVSSPFTATPKTTSKLSSPLKKTKPLWHPWLNSDKNNDDKTLLSKGELNSRFLNNKRTGSQVHQNSIYKIDGLVQGSSSKKPSIVSNQKLDLSDSTARDKLVKKVTESSRKSTEEISHDDVHPGKYLHSQNLTCSKSDKSKFSNVLTKLDSSLQTSGKKEPETTSTLAISSWKTDDGNLTDQISSRLIKDETIDEPFDANRGRKRKMSEDNDDIHSKKNTGFAHHQLDTNKKNSKERHSVKGNPLEKSQKEGKKISTKVGDSDVIIKPVAAPPSRSEVEQSIVTHGLNSVQPPTAYCSAEQDLPDRPV